MTETTTPQKNQPDDEIDLGELVSAVWNGRWKIILISTCFMLVSVFYALSVADEYRSTAILSPASSSSSSSLSKLAGQFGGLASLAGVDLGGGSSSDKTAIAIELMLTWGFLESFIKNNELEVEVYAAKKWDRASNKLVLDDKLYDAQSGTWVLDENEVTDQGAPSSWRLYEKIKPRITISRNKKTGLVSLSVEHYSPYIAKKWVELMVVEINQHMQLQDRTEALSSIAYLKKQIVKTDIAEMRSIFYQLIEEQTKTLMLAEISEEYIFKTLSPAKVSEQKIKPKRVIIVIIGALLGLAISIIWVLILHFSRKAKS